MKNKPSVKIIVLSIIDIILVGVLVCAVYITFIADADFKKLGYSYSDINLIHQYQLEEKVTEYNQSLVYAINSNDFQQKNIDYYLLFNHQIDYTRVINELAEKYTVEELSKLKSFVTEDQLIELVDLDKVTNVDGLKSLLDKQYEFTMSVKLANGLQKEDLDALLQLNTLEHPENYLKYIHTGYTSETIAALYNMSEETFNRFADIRYFEKLNDLLKVSGFKIQNLARYFWHMQNYGSSVERAVTRVNINAEFVDQKNLNYLDFYTTNPKDADMSTITGLVNKSHVLSKEYAPENLVEIDADYRGNNQPLIKEAAEAFVKMAKDCEKAVDRKIIAYSSYRSYSIETSTYATMLTSVDSTEKSIAGFTSKPGYSEHQTGLAVDIAQKGYSYTELEECKSYDWLNENCYKYGFVRRYPGDKAWITGYSGNAYHYRYVGEDVANMMHEYGWVLEEYSYLFNGD